METNFKCKFCSICLGHGCLNQLPGMGGVQNNKNFILNCSAWSKIPFGPFESNNAILRLAPMTGAEENVGYSDEKQFYFDLVKECSECKIKISIGDGTPDSKLLWGIEATKFYSQKAAVFIKPYENKKILERFEWALDIAEYCGIDIDAYNIVTMRNKVHLEKKSPSLLLELKKEFSKKGIPFVIKGIFTKEDIDLVQQVKPDVAFVSNHGGRIETIEGSSAEFLEQNYKVLKSNCNELWVDGGIRSKADFKKAESYGVSQILLGRPFAISLCQKKSFKNLLI